KEAVQIIHKMWTEDYPTFSGKYYTIDGPINEPKSAKPGRKVPLWIGGGGEQVTLPLVAQYGGACHVRGGPAQVIAAKLAILQGHCERVGRDYNEITRSSSFNVYPILPGVDPEHKTVRLRETLGNISYETFSKTNFVGTVDDIAARVQAGIEAGAN